MLVGISGKAQSGKDTFARFFMFEYGVRTGRKFSYAPMLYSMDGISAISSIELKKFADALKQMVTLLTGVGRSKLEEEEVKNTSLGPEWDDMTPRDMLQRLGTDLIRNQLHKDAWVNALFSTYDDLQSKWIITDMRFPNEAQAVRDRGGLLVRVERPDIKLMDHESETGLDDWTDWDLVFDNDKKFDKVQHFARELVFDMFDEKS
jgi:hypothetical protein